MILDDVLDTSGNFLTKHAFEEKYGIQNISFLKYQGFINCIKLFLKRENIIIDKTESDFVRPFMPTILICVLKNQKGCADIYNSLINHNIIPKATVKWSQNLPDKNFMWKNIFNNIFMTTNDSKLQWFQYRLIHRILPLKPYLKLIGVSDCDLCTFCKNHVESYIHLFSSCPFVTPLWIDLETLISYATIFIELNDVNIIFGIINHKHNNVINLILLICKYYIYKCTKYLDNPPCFKSMINEITKYASILENVRCKTKNQSDFIDVWKTIQHYM